MLARTRGCRLALCLLLALNAQIRSTLASTASDSRVPIATEVWRRGDDGLTSNFYVAVQNALERNSTFLLHFTDASLIFKVSIADHVMTAVNDGREQVLYTVEFSIKDSRELGSLKGWCWIGELEDCANQVEIEATHLIRQIR